MIAEIKSLWQVLYKAFQLSGVSNCYANAAPVRSFRQSAVTFYPKSPPKLSYGHWKVQSQTGGMAPRDEFSRVRFFCRRETVCYSLSLSLSLANSKTKNEEFKKIRYEHKKSFDLVVPTPLKKIYLVMIPNALISYKFPASIEK